MISFIQFHMFTHVYWAKSGSRSPSLRPVDPFLCLIGIAPDSSHILRPSNDARRPSWWLRTSHSSASSDWLGINSTRVWIKSGSWCLMWTLVININVITFINSWRCSIKCSSWIGDEIKKYSDSSPCKILPHFTHDLWKPHLWIIFHDFHSCSGAFKHDTHPIPTMTKRDEINEMPVFSKPDPFRTVVSLATNESGNPDPHHLRVNF